MKFLKFKTHDNEKFDTAITDSLVPIDQIARIEIKDYFPDESRDQRLSKSQIIDYSGRAHTFSSATQDSKIVISQMIQEELND